MLSRNVRVFSGTGSALSDPTSVLVSGNVIERIATDADAEPGAPVTVIEGGGRTLMPGLIDAHLTFYDLPIAEAVNADPDCLQIRQSVGARRMLLNGFTSIRDVSGPVFGLKRAIDEGLVAGPRSPYPGKPGVVEGGALADLLLADGDPIANIKLLEDPSRNLLVIMKEGKIQKAAGAVIGSGAP